MARARDEYPAARPEAPEGAFRLAPHARLDHALDVVLHAVAVLLDPVLHFGLPALLVPGLAPWKPVGVAAGVVAGWLTLALAASFRAKRWMGHRAWRLLHYASFGAFVLFLGHALTVGADLKGLSGPLLVRSRPARCSG